MVALWKYKKGKLQICKNLLPFSMYSDTFHVCRSFTITVHYLKWACRTTKYLKSEGHGLLTTSVVCLVGLICIRRKQMAMEMEGMHRISQRHKDNSACCMHMKASKGPDTVPNQHIIWSADEKFFFLWRKGFIRTLVRALWDPILLQKGKRFTPLTSATCIPWDGF